jgi:hypothetical protein
MPTEHLQVKVINDEIWLANKEATFYALIFDKKLQSFIPQPHFVQFSHTVIF